MEVAETNPRKRASWGASLFGRSAICLLVLAAYSVTEHWIPVGIMLGLAAHSLTSISARSNLTIAVTLLVLLHALWTLVAVAVGVFDLAPVSQTPARMGVLTAGHASTAVLGAAQFLYLITLSLERLPREVEFHYLGSKKWQWIMLLLAFLISIPINGTSFVLGGGYEGNLNQYWAGLPSVFVAVIAACFIQSKSIPITVWAATNALVGYWIATGNRSEVLILFIYANLAFILTKPVFALSKVRAATTGVVLGIGFFIFSAIGLVRTSGLQEIAEAPIRSIFAGVVQGDRLTVSTVGSSVYSGLVAIDISENEGIYYGETFAGQVVNSAPSFIPVPWNRYPDLYLNYESRYQTMGGFGLIGESYLNFGRFGPLILGVAFVILLRFLINVAPSSLFMSWFLLAFVLYSQRYFFYGYVYLHNLILIFLPIGLVILLGRAAKLKGSSK